MKNNGSTYFIFSLKLFLFLNSDEFILLIILINSAYIKILFQGTFGIKQLNLSEKAYTVGDFI